MATLWRAETAELAAVVSDGAGARSTTEDMDQDEPALAKIGFFDEALR